MLRQNRKGQSVFEYTVIMIIVIGALLGIQNYFKRGIQGRWRQAVDQLGDQYDPRFGNASIRHTLDSNSTTHIMTVDGVDGFYTMRKDTANSIERKVGTQETGAY